MRMYFLRSVALVLLIFLFADAAVAADGYFLIGYGPRQKALAGAGAADQRDAMALSVNPAGIVGLRRQFQLGMTVINAERGYYTSGPTRVIAAGYVESGRPWFPVPNSGYIRPIDDNSAWSVVSYANGGINTSFGWGNWRAPRGGLFGGGFAGGRSATIFHQRRLRAPFSDAAGRGDPRRRADARRADAQCAGRGGLYPLFLQSVSAVGHGL
ncbi:outer membrane protein transport protein [Methylocystis echinoides]|uniref:OmpP1/FadL family transporter n=1 Tax=Methylocystis echinoides TaxID=29468 RepID=UPI00341954DE